ncbi:MAG TPA: hypothetical protein VNJ08_11775 [Bacteriovoracaceae bacterium]|nr:hypothetical protein [Bacteriovoracaceae bacterium]
MKKFIILASSLLIMGLGVVGCSGDRDEVQREEAGREIESDDEVEVDRDVLGDDEVELND